MEKDQMTKIILFAVVMVCIIGSYFGGEHIGYVRGFNEGMDHMMRIRSFDCEIQIPHPTGGGWMGYVPLTLTTYECGMLEKYVEDLDIYLEAEDTSGYKFYRVNSSADWSWGRLELGGVT